MKKKERKSGLLEISCDDGYTLHRKGDANIHPISKIVIPAIQMDDWEEIPVSSIPPYTEQEYSSKVTELIRERYSLDDEFALINNVMSGATEKHKNEYAQYQEFREKCKKKAKEELLKRTRQEEE